LIKKPFDKEKYCLVDRRVFEKFAAVLFPCLLRDSGSEKSVVSND